jgi:hypothetical protein
LPTWDEIYSRIGERPSRHKRNRCPIHDGDSPCSVALDESRGIFYCHVCHAGGDKFSFIKQLYKCDFKSALRWFGLEPGKPPAPDPAAVRRLRVRSGLKAWSKQIGRELRDEFYCRERVITRALDRLRRDPEDAWAWNWLGWALRDHGQIEYKLDLLIGTEEQQLEAFRQWRAAA